ncbi:hypothetical protein GF337_08600 [candidate division KSB1 bacterium]|nr:hypothetical protein [candidate division KSB1 bacterium]
MANSSNSDVATKKDLENLKIELSSDLKKDLRKYATKTDLKNLHIDFKKELTKYATKEELKELETRLIDQLASKESVSIIATQVLKNSDNITALHKLVDELSDSLDNKFEAMMTLLDAIARDLKDGKTEKAAIDHSLNRHEQRIDDHEMRIDKLERKSA